MKMIPKNVMNRLEIEGIKVPIENCDKIRN